MFVTVEHHISNADKFWAAAEKELSNLPYNLKLHLCTPSKDEKTAYCIWEADSVKSLKNWLEGISSDFSQNEYHEINEEMAIGLPKTSAGTQSAA